MEPQELADIIDAALDDYDDTDDDESDSPIKPSRTRTFEEAGLLTTDKGLVLSFADGSEFQVTIVKVK